MGAEVSSGAGEAPQGAQGWREADPRVPGPRSLPPAGHSQPPTPRKATLRPSPPGASTQLRYAAEPGHTNAEDRRDLRGLGTRARVAAPQLARARQYLGQTHCSLMIPVPSSMPRFFSLWSPADQDGRSRHLLLAWSFLNF